MSSGANTARPGSITARGRALALVEVVLSIAILGGLMVAVMNAVGRAAVTRARTVERLQGSSLGESLMGEILSKAYDNPTAAPALSTVELSVLGVTVSVTTPLGLASRDSFDGIDDFDGWRSKPPLDRSGTPIPGYSGWAQSVEVERAVLATPNGAESGTDTGLKRITVIITRDGREISRMVALRSRGWEEALDAR